MTKITTHVLDTGTGRPAAGVAVRLEREGTGGPVVIGLGKTDADGRVNDWLPEGVEAGTYRLIFATGAWFAAAKRETLYPEVAILFTVAEGAAHYHVPLLLAPFGYTTYRGS